MCVKDERYGLSIQFSKSDLCDLKTNEPEFKLVIMCYQCMQILELYFTKYASTSTDQNFHIY